MKRVGIEGRRGYGGFSQDWAVPRKPSPPRDGKHCFPTVTPPTAGTE